MYPWQQKNINELLITYVKLIAAIYISRKYFMFETMSNIPQVHSSADCSIVVIKQVQILPKLLKLCAACSTTTKVQAEIKYM